MKRGGDFDVWDLQVRIGLFSKSRGLLVIEEHGGGKQYLKFKCRAHYSPKAFVLAVVIATMAVLSGLSNQWVINGIMDIIQFQMILRK